MFKRIDRGSTIGIIAPSYIPNKQRLEKGISYLNNTGFKTKLGQHLNEKHGYFAGTDEQRLADLHEMFIDPVMI